MPLPQTHPNDQSPTSLPTNIDRQQMSHTLLSQLKTRNSHNTQIIRRYLRKIIKKQMLHAHQLLHNQPLEQQAQSLDEMGVDEVPQQPERCDRLQMEQCQQLPKTDQTLKDRFLLTTVDSYQKQPTQTVLTLFETVKLLSQQKNAENSCALSNQVQNHPDSNFLNQLKYTYVKQLFEKTKHNRTKYKQEPRRQINDSSLRTNKFVNINVKSLVFGGKSSDDVAPKCNRISTEARPNIDATVQNAKRSRGGSKVTNNFLPSICRQLGKLKRSQVCIQARMKCEQQGIRRDYGYQMCQLDSMQRIGISFRINTLQIKRQY